MTERAAACPCRAVLRAPAVLRALVSAGHGRVGWVDDGGAAARRSRCHAGSALTHSAARRRRRAAAGAACTLSGPRWSCCAPTKTRPCARASRVSLPALRRCGHCKNLKPAWIEAASELKVRRCVQVVTRRDATRPAWGGRAPAAAAHAPSQRCGCWPCCGAWVCRTGAGEQRWSCRAYQMSRSAKAHVVLQGKVKLDVTPRP